MRELVPVLARELRAGGDASAVVEGRVAGACALVWVGDTDESALHDAWHAGIPIVAVSDEQTLPYVLDTDIVRVERGHGFPVEAIAAAVAKKLGNDGTALAARLPVLRGAVCDELRRRGQPRATVTWAEGPGGPEGFYLGLGFRPTGERSGDQVVAELDLDPA